MKKIAFCLIFISLNIVSFAQQQCNYSHCKFENNVNFKNAQFDSSANFHGASFFFKSEFQKAKFYYGADFKYANFLGCTNFGQTHFKSHSYFDGVHFRAKVDFDKAHFDSTVVFFDVVFDSVVFFNNVQFDALTNFYSTTFNGDVDFTDSKFYQDVNFSSVSFDSSAYFWNTIFVANVNFNNAKLPYILDFSGVSNLNKQIDLTKTRINEKFGICKINLINADIDKINFRYARFKLYFPEGTLPEIKFQVYEKLLAKQLKEGYVFSYEKLSKEYAEFLYLESGNYNSFFGSVFNFIDWIWWDYGYAKWRVLLNSVILFFIFALINAIWFKNVTLNVYENKDFLKICLKIEYKYKLIYFLKKLVLSFYYTSFIFWGIKFDIKKLKLSQNLSKWKVFNTIYFLIIYFIGTICLGFIGNFIIG